jgi:uncharacterized protein (DUF1697 family)
MSAYVALLRAVNLGPHNKVSMAALRKFAEDLELEKPRTLLQSGNLVFRSRSHATVLERMLETEAEKRLDLQTDFFVRDADEWDDIIAGNPFAEASKQDPAHLLVMPLRNAPGVKMVAALKAAIKGREVTAVIGRHAYIVYPDGIGTSKLTNSVIESKLGTRGTGRNWNTVIKLKALARE